MLRVALTGSVAAGKSTVARVWEEAGVPVVRSDALAREAVAPGNPGLEAVIEAFGEDLRRPDGTLDRGALRDRVFRDDEARKRLEAILHPRIAELREAWEEARRAEGAALVVAEIPLLFETGTEGEFDVVVTVDAARSERLRRLVDDRDLDPDEARRIMDAQMDPAEKRERADEVLVNDGTVAELREKALVLLDRLRRGMS